MTCFNSDSQPPVFRQAGRPDCPIVYSRGSRHRFPLKQGPATGAELVRHGAICHNVMGLYFRGSQMNEFQPIEAEMEGDEKRPRVQSVARAAAILFAVAQGENGVSRKDISRIAQLSTQTTYHLLHTLNRIRSEEHTSELQSLMRSSYAVF